MAGCGGRIAPNCLLSRNIVNSLGPLGASCTVDGPSPPRGWNTFVASFRPGRNVLSPPEGTLPASGGEKLPPREELGDTVPENIAGGGEGFAVGLIAGFNESDSIRAGSSRLETPSLAPPSVFSLKICVKDGAFDTTCADGVPLRDSSFPSRVS